MSGPKEIDELRIWVNPRSDQVFFAALFPEWLTGSAIWFARFIPKEQVGDFRDWNQIEPWTARIANAFPQGKA